MRAGAIALELFRKNDNHPGAAHYVIHAFDDPLHAPIALAAAEKYATIAPAVSHARHMPTHIFIQHGMWDKVSIWNHSAFQAGLDLWKPGDPVGDLNHSSDWGQYGDLQLGDLETSKEWIAKAADVLKNNPGDRRSISTLKTMQARHIIESKQWETKAVAEVMSPDELLALGLSAANLGDLSLANQVVDRLAAMVSQEPNNEQLTLIHHEVAAMTLHSESMATASVDVTKRQQAIDLIESAIALRETQRAPNGAASPLKPVHELAAEMMLEMGRFDDAARLFKTSLLRLPGRPWSLLGAAQAYAKLGNSAMAASYYDALLSIWKDDSHTAVKEAKRYLNR